MRDSIAGLCAAAHNASQAGNSTLAKALDVTRFEVYESYLDEEYTNNRAKRFEDQELSIGAAVAVVMLPPLGRVA